MGGGCQKDREICFKYLLSILEGRLRPKFVAFGTPTSDKVGVHSTVFAIKKRAQKVAKWAISRATHGVGPRGLYRGIEGP